MTENKAAARVLEHPNGQKRELSQTHKNILLHFVRFGKLFAKTCAVMLTLLGLAAFAGAVQGGRAAHAGGHRGRQLGAGRMVQPERNGGVLMRGILIDPGCEPKVCKLPDTAQGLNGFLGGAVQIRRFGQVFAALVYAHQATQAMPNRHYIDRWYYGRLLIVGWRSNRMTDLPHDLAEELCRKWSSVEVQV